MVKSLSSISVLSVLIEKRNWETQPHTMGLNIWPLQWCVTNLFRDFRGSFWNWPIFTNLTVFQSVKSFKFCKTFELCFKINVFPVLTFSCSFLSPSLMIVMARWKVVGETPIFLATISRAEPNSALFIWTGLAWAFTILCFAKSFSISNMAIANSDHNLNVNTFWGGDSFSVIDFRLLS